MDLCGRGGSRLLRLGAVVPLDFRDDQRAGLHQVAAPARRLPPCAGPARGSGQARQLDSASPEGHVALHELRQDFGHGPGHTEGIGSAGHRQGVILIGVVALGGPALRPVITPFAMRSTQRRRAYFFFPVRSPNGSRRATCRSVRRAAMSASARAVCSESAGTNTPGAAVSA